MLKAFKNIFKGGSSTSTANERKRKLASLVRKNEDPFRLWENLSELGDGAFGKVYKVCLYLSIIFQSYLY